ncbi:MAG: hypothetical protein J5755_02145 [Clostridia bacterium]|nr:hypothetical protein [Clostridia bacterium]
MKRNIKILTIVLCLVLAATMTIVFVGCKDKGPNRTDYVANSGHAQVWVPHGSEGEASLAQPLQEFSVDLGAISAYDALEMCAAIEGLTVTTQASDYGAFITAVNELSQDAAAGRYMSIYINDESQKGEFGDPMTVNGVTFYPTAKGIGEVYIKDGTILFFTTIVYSF